MNTKQFEFDAVVNHLYKQGRPAKDSEGKCLYRYGELSCAVGCRIPDEDYRDGMEGERVGEIYQELPDEIGQYLDMFNQLQNVHDTCNTEYDGTFVKADLVAYLSNVAKAYSLTFTNPDGE